jgi:UDP-glucose:(glucosyl)LPS alpha-1,2-glucosyltransferase
MSLKIVYPEYELNEVSQKAMGGTEMMQKALYERLPTDLLDQFQIICSRVREIDPDKPSILWLHDTHDDPESQHLKDVEARTRFKKLVFVSNYQMVTYMMAHGIQYGESTIMKNAIEPIEYHTKPDDGKINLIYHTTPHRGLALLLNVFNELVKTNEDIHLDVYSSFTIYGWDDKDAEFDTLFDFCREHDQITYHGGQPNSVVREALKKAHIFAYPSVWPETSCISMIEAMSAGVMPVCPRFAALPETTAGFALDYPWTEDGKAHMQVFYHALNLAIGFARECFIEKTNDAVSQKLNFQKYYADTFYGWDLRAAEWTHFLKSLQEKP